MKKKLNRHKRKSTAPTPPPIFLFFSKKTLVLWMVLVTLSLFCWYHSNRQKLVWAAWGEAPGDHFGDKVAPAGDVNGDGYADVAVWASSHGDSAGKVYIYYGSKNGLSPAPDWEVQGESPKDQYGHSFGTVGDVNRDGYGDFIVGAQDFGSPKGKDVGKAYLYLGSPKGLNVTPVWTQTGQTPFELLGDCSGPAGDINHDGLGDVVIGSYGYDHFRGKAQIFYGSKEGGLSIKSSWTAYGEDPNDWYGYSVASTGDIKGDGYPGVVIGAKQYRKDNLTRAGKVYVYYGSKDGLSKIPSWTASGETEGSLFGWRAVSAGDVKGNGHQGLIISAYMYGKPEKHNAGKIYVYYGSTEGLPKDPSWTYEGETAGSLFGYSIASGDFNHDGYSDILVGAPYYGNDRGKIYLFLGGPNGLSMKPSWTAVGKEGERLGSYVANVGDVNGDGYPDILVGAPNNSEKGEAAGKVYLFYGNSTGKLTLYPSFFTKGTSR